MARQTATRKSPLSIRNPSLSSRLTSHRLAILVGWVSRAIGVCCQLLVVRFIIQAVGQTGYGAFGLMTGLMTWFMLADLGVGPSLQNHISERRAAGRSYDDLIATAGMIGVGTALVLICMLYFSSPLLSHILLRKFPYSDEHKELLFLGVGISYVLLAIGNLILKIWYAEQRGVHVNSISGISPVIGLASVFLLRRSFFSSQPGYDVCLLTLGYVSASTSVLFALFLSRWVSSLIRARNRLVSWTLIRQILVRASNFWIFAILVAITLQADYIVLSQILTPEDIARYNLATKIFSLMFFVFNTALLLEWPRMAERVAKGESKGIAKYATQLALIGVVWIAIATLLLVPALPFLLRILAPGHAIEIGLKLSAVFGIYFMLRCWTDTFSMVLQSASRMKIFWLLGPIQALLSAGLQLMLAPILGVYGIVIGLTLSFALTGAWALPRSVLRLSNAP